MSQISENPTAGVVELDAPRLTLMGDAAVLFEAPGPLLLGTQKRIWACSDGVAEIAGVVDRQPGMNNLLVVFDPDMLDPAALETMIMEIWSTAGEDAPAGKLIELPIRYGGEGGPDLGLVCDHLKLTAEEVADIHSSAEYVIFAPGTMPGFGYLFGLPERLFVPRREVPVTRPRTLNVSIAGLQCSIVGPPGAYGAATAPTGWYMIGKLVDPPMPFDLNAEPPGLMRPGDRIKFVNMGIAP